MTRAKKYLPEVRARAVRTVLEYQGEYDSQWAKIGRPAETFRSGVRHTERDQGPADASTTQERERIKALERAVRELRQANEIPRKASAYFTQAELDRWFKP